MSERAYDRAAELREEIEQRLAELADVLDPEDVLDYVERLAARMRVELDEP